MKESNSILVIVGKGKLTNKLKKQIEKSYIRDKVYFTGNKEGAELLTRYNIAQLFVLPGTFEPFGAAINEALLAGCPVLCSELAGASIFIAKNNGKLFNPYDKVQLQLMNEEALANSITISEQVSSIRNNLMPFSFDEKLKELFENL